MFGTIGCALCNETKENIWIRIFVKTCVFMVTNMPFYHKKYDEILEKIEKKLKWQKL